MTKMNQRIHVLFAMFTILLSVQWQTAVCSEDDNSKLDKTNRMKQLLKLIREVYGENGDFDGISSHPDESLLIDYLQQQHNHNDDNLNVYNEDESTINNAPSVEDELANVADDEGAQQSEQQKRSAYLRFGKRNPAYLRFGRSQAYLRFGKRAPSAYLRFGKRNPAYLRFGRSVEHSQPVAAATVEKPIPAN